jgi:hypothetical protein
MYCVIFIICDATNESTIIKGKDKGHPIKVNEGPEGEQIYSSTLPST